MEALGSTWISRVDIKDLTSTTIMIRALNLHLFTKWFRIYSICLDQTWVQELIKLIIIFDRKKDLCRIMKTATRRRNAVCWIIESTKQDVPDKLHKGVPTLLCIHPIRSVFWLTDILNRFMTTFCAWIDNFLCADWNLKSECVATEKHYLPNQYKLF